MLQYAVILGALAQLIGTFFYIRETVRGDTKPNKVTWLMWSVAPLIATAAALSTGVRWAVLPVFMAGFGPLLVFMASFVNPKAYWKLEKFDYLCGAFSVLALALWAITNQPLLAIIFSILSDGFAAVPTIIKSWRRPDTESVGMYGFGIFNAFTSFFALKKYGLSELAFPIYIIICDSIIVMAFYKNKFKKYLT